MKDTIYKLAEERGMDNCNVSFSTAQDLRISWRGHVIKLTHHFDGAPQTVKVAVANFILDRIQKKPGTNRLYSVPEFTAWALSKNGTEAMRRTYLRYTRTLSGTAQGDYLNLNELHRELLAEGRIKAEDVLISWTKDRQYARAGWFSGLSRVIAISRLFDHPDHRDLAKYVLYHELCHAEQRYDNLSHDSAFRMRMAKYPDMTGLETRLSRVCHNARNGRFAPPPVVRPKPAIEAVQPTVQTAVPVLAKRERPGKLRATTLNDYL